MRLSSLALVDRYTRSFRLTDKNLVERGPDISPPAEVLQQVATGTYGGASDLAHRLALSAGRDRTKSTPLTVKTLRLRLKGHWGMV